RDAVIKAQTGIIDATVAVLAALLDGLGFVFGRRLGGDIIHQAVLDSWIDVKLLFGFVAEQLAFEPVDLALGGREFSSQTRNFCPGGVVFLFQRSGRQRINYTIKSCVYYIIAGAEKGCGDHLFRRFLTTNSKPSINASNSVRVNARTGC